MTKAVKQSVSKTKAKIKEMLLESSGDNAPDYHGNLFFEPKMTWTDLIEWCNDKKVIYKLDKNMFGNYILIDCMEFYENGKINVKGVVGSLARNRSFEQFKELIRILKDL